MSKNKGGLLFGVVVGTLMGVLFAPRKGKDLRNALKKEVEDGGLGAETLKKNFVEMGQDIAETAEEIYEQPEVQKQVKVGRKYVSGFLKTARKNIDEAKSSVERAGKKYYEKGQEKFDDARDKMEGKIDMMKKKISSRSQKNKNSKRSPKKDS